MRNIGPTVWTKLAHSATGRCPREGTMLCRAARANETSLRPAIPARISSTRRGRIMNCGTRSIPSKKSRPTRDSRSFFVGYTSSKRGLSSELGVTGPEPVSPTGNFDLVARRLLRSPSLKAQSRSVLNSRLPAKFRPRARAFIGSDSYFRTGVFGESNPTLVGLPRRGGRDL